MSAVFTGKKYLAARFTILSAFDPGSAQELQQHLHPCSAIEAGKLADHIGKRTARRIQVTAREVNAERADHRPHTGQLATSLQIADPNLQSPDCQQYGSPLWSGLRRNRPPSSRSSAASQSTTFARRSHRTPVSRFQICNFLRPINFQLISGPLGEEL
jgi:hypothetical protein